MKRLLLLGAVLFCATTWVGSALSQEIGAFVDEAGTQTTLDSRTGLIPNPDAFDFPSAVIWVVAHDLPELSGYEYRLLTSDLAAIESTPVIYPSTASNSGTNGDIRVNTGTCFQLGSSEAGPSLDAIRLVKHQFTWVRLPQSDAYFCVVSSEASGADMPLYTECVESPASLPFKLNEPYCFLSPVGCCRVVFEFNADGTFANQCVIPVESSSWGALKAAY
jgi:hypothetical protein